MIGIWHANTHKQIDSFKEHSQNEKYVFKTIQEVKPVVEKIILKAFVKYGDKIKKDEKLIEVYEDILLALVKVRSEKAAF